MKRILALILVGLACSVEACPAMAENAALSDFFGDARWTPLDDASLRETRGGFYTVDGLVFDFAAEVRSEIQGQTVLESRLVWAPDGPIWQDETGQFMDLGSLGRGASFASPSGMTTFAHRVSGEGFSSFVFNSASDVDVRQTLDLQILLPGFELVQGAINVSRIVAGFTGQIDAGLLQSVRR